MDAIEQWLANQATQEATNLSSELQAFVSLAALAAAVVASIAAWRGIMHQEERERSRQASRVYSSPVEGQGNMAHLAEPGVEVTNGSDLPIYDVTVEIEEIFSGCRDSHNQRNIMPTSSKLFYVLPRVLTDKWGWHEHTDAHGGRYFTAPEELDKLDFSVVLTFRDAANQYWKRDKFGTLSPLKTSGSFAWKIRKAKPNSEELS